LAQRNSILATDDGGIAEPYGHLMNLACNLMQTASRAADRPALRLDDQIVTYRQLDDRSARLAALVRSLGIKPGDRVGLMMANVPEFAVAYYGILRAGAVVVPMNVLLKEREVAFYLTDAGARLLIAWDGLAEAASGAAAAGAEMIAVSSRRFDAELEAVDPHPEVVSRAGEDTAVILYTSGTTGTPKGAELTHLNLARNAEVTENLLGMDEEDVIFGALPLFHCFGQTCGLNTVVRTGACLTLLPRFDAGGALAILERHGVTIFQGVPTMYAAMMNHPAATRTDSSRLRMCVSGGAALPLGVLEGFEQVFDCVILEGYGLSETSPVASFNPPQRRKPGSIGIAVPGVEMAVVADDGTPVPAGEVGEIVIRGHNVMKGYWNRPEATAAAIVDGWFHSGDLAKIDPDGYFFIVDRMKDMIIRGGYNVYPREIEEVLYQHPAVREAAVIGVPDDYFGEEVAAVISLRSGADATPAQLVSFVKDSVAAYKYPRRLWIVDDLPKGPTGKILKRQITVPDRADSQVGVRP
jgi:long-chain acyl-CoA synthetase